MHVLLLINPAATAADPALHEAVRTALVGAAVVERVEVVQTERRGHARELAAAAGRDGVDVVAAVGGDGTVNEVVDGLLGGAPAGPAHPAPGDDPTERTTGGPALVVVPNGATNVLARALGLPRHPLRAAHALVAALEAGHERRIGVGLLEHLDDARPAAAPGAAQHHGPPADGTAASDGTVNLAQRPRTADVPGEQRAARWFVLNAGLGLDAAAIAHVELGRLAGRRATNRAYALATLQAWRASDRTDAPLQVRTPDGLEESLAAVMVTNTDPWTYLGPRRMRPTPRSSFDLGLDATAARRMHLGGTLESLGRMLAHRPAPLRTTWSAHDQPWLEVRSARPVALQVDGDYLGETTGVRLTARPDAVRLVVPLGGPPLRSR
ncbi:diacylglycerol/lipid kinase family protein [Angustibacter aerolatus]